MGYRVWVLGLSVLGFVGCAHQTTRLQAPEEPERPKQPVVKTIGDVTTFGNAQPIPVSGVGLVVGLEGTGGDAPASSFRTLLEDQLKKDGVENPKEALASPNTSMVFVSGLIAAGAHKDDPFDIEVTLPPQSRTTSLRGGYLRACYLFNYDTKANIAKSVNVKYDGPNQLEIGHKLASAEGPLLVGFGDSDESVRVREARVWGGGRSKLDRGFYLIMNNDDQRIPIVQKVADRINETFHGPNRGSLNNVAEAKTKAYLTLRVPIQYKNNLGRFLRVVRLIPYQETPPPKGPYRKWLQEELLDPNHTVTAALRLEALGKDAEETLKLGLESPHPLVRFTSAEALAYLGNPRAGEELANAVDRQPLLRAFSLAAFASLDEAISHVKLRELMDAPSAETRYGAFRALRVLDEHDPAVKGEMLGNSFWLHRVARGSPALVHISTSRRAEVVLFGDDPCLLAPFSFLAGEFTLTAGRDDTHCTISRLSLHNGEHRQQCGLGLNEVLRTLADMGGMYPEVVELLRQAGTFQCLTCPVAIDALPQAPSVEDLARYGANNVADPNDSTLVSTPEDLGATPTLYDKTNGDQALVRRHSEDSNADAADDSPVPARKGK